jgi:hypothetical protein
LQAGFDLAQLDAETAHLHLMVDPADVFQLAVLAVAGQVAGAVHALAGSADGLGTKRSAVSPGRSR